MTNSINYDSRLANIILTTPLSGTRNVDVDTHIQLEITKPTELDYVLNLQSLNVQINGIEAILGGEFQSPSVGIAADVGTLREEQDRLLVSLSKDGYATITMPVLDSSKYAVGTILRLGAEQMQVIAIDGYTSQVTATRGFNLASISTHSVGSIIKILGPNGLPLLEDTLLGEIPATTDFISLNVSNPALYTNQSLVQINSEIMQIADADGYSVILSRGYDSTTSSNHLKNETIHFQARNTPTRFITTTAQSPFLPGELVKLQQQDTLLTNLGVDSLEFLTSNIAQYRIHDILRINLEKLQVTAINGPQGKITVKRGYDNTTPLIHFQDSIVYIESSSTTTQILNTTSNRIELKDPVKGFVGYIDTAGALRPGRHSTISSLDRGYTGTILENEANNKYEVTIIPNSPLPNNSVVVVSTDINSSYYSNTQTLPTIINAVPSYKSFKSFAFRTEDTLAPQILNFPSSIQFSNLQFTIVDMLGSGIDLNSINVTINYNNQNTSAISDGYIEDGYFEGYIASDTGQRIRDTSIISINEGYVSSTEIRLRPKMPYPDGANLSATVEVADIFGNKAVYNKQQITNHVPQPRIQFLQVQPTIDSVLNPQNAFFEAKFIGTESIPLSFINLELRVGNNVFPIVKAGRFKAPYLGFCRPGHQLTIRVDNLVDLSLYKLYGESIYLHFYLVEANELGDIPSGVSPLYSKTFNYSTVPSTIAPLIDNFLPTGASVPSSASISFRVLSQVPEVPLNANSIIATVNAIIALDNGNYKNNYTGSITTIQGSGGDSLLVTLTPPNPFTIGATITVDITASDASDNMINSSFSFIIANTNVPLITITPPSGSFSSLTRVSLTASEPSLIYYTIDGSAPIIGQLNTFYSASPVENIPIYNEGITQIKAFAISAANIQGPLVSETYDLNPFVPVVTILSPESNASINENNITIEYSVSITRGYLTKVETILNNGIPVNTQNNLLNSKALVMGLQAGSNTIKLRITDNFGSKVTATVNVIVQPSQIARFDIAYAPLVCPTFTERPLIPAETSFAEIFDTSTVTIIGNGQRSEVLVSYALGSGQDGRPVNFVRNQNQQDLPSPDGRHFELSNYPVDPDSIEVWLYRKNRNLKLSFSEFAINYNSGQIVLDHPLELGESLTVKYIALADINAPRIYRADQLPLLYQRHGEPTITNTLSLGAQIAFENGAQRVMTVQALPLVQDSSWSNSFKVLEQQETYWIVPIVSNTQLQFYPSVRLAALQHAIKMSNIKYRKERVVIGYRLSNEVFNSLPVNSSRSNRMILLDIDRDAPILRTNMNTSIELNGSYIAAAIAGLSSSLPIASPLTYQSTVGFTLKTQQKSPRTELDQLVTQGFMPILATSGGGQIYRGRTGYIGFAEPAREEVSIQRSADYISKNLRELLQNQFIGSSINSTLLKTIRIATEQFLQSKSDIISSSTVADIDIDINEPRQINLSILITPLYPLNNFEIAIGISMTL